ncbi:hypothetical protein Scep_003394 [Stephania cephalantha]|uniref:Lipid droplet-associated hydrolase n=1 Tax=Stephania cephalantha TaxID=152367 RepID=A0AAP0PVR2_9MAGN
MLPLTRSPVAPISRFLCKSINNNSVRVSKSTSGEMAAERSRSIEQSRASLRLCNVSSFTTELLELRSENPLLHVVVIPGNPGVALFYKEFVEAMYERLGGRASVTGRKRVLCYILVFSGRAHFRNEEGIGLYFLQNWEKGRLFSLQDQIDHKVSFINQEFGDTEVPLYLVSHSIGSYISLEVFRRFPEKVKYCIGLYPFLSLNKKSSKQIIIGKIAGSGILSKLLSLVLAMFGILPMWASSFLVRTSMGKSWSTSAIEAVCNYLLQYHVMRNVFHMAMTEFQKLAEAPDWMFMRGKQEKIAFLFGSDDHWGPLSMFEEISKEVSDVSLSIENEGHTHGFCCTKAGSEWVAGHVVSLIEHQILPQ